MDNKKPRSISIRDMNEDASAGNAAAEATSAKASKNIKITHFDEIEETEKNTDGLKQQPKTAPKKPKAIIVQEHQEPEPEKEQVSEDDNLQTPPADTSKESAEIEKLAEQAAAAVGDDKTTAGQVTADEENTTDTEEPKEEVLSDTAADSETEEAVEAAAESNDEAAEPPEELPEPVVQPPRPDIAPAKKPLARAATPVSPESFGADPGIDKAIDDIMAKDGDSLLAAEDERLAFAFSQDKPGLKDKLRGFFAAWWRNKWARYLTILVIAVLVVTLSAVPATRYAILNTAGVRVSTSLTVLDGKTSQPLKDIQIKLDDANAVTDATGQVRIYDLKLGAHQLLISKPGFAPIEQNVVLGWGSNPLGDYRLTATGSRFVFKLTDFLSGKPVSAKVGDEVSYRANSATIDKEGVAELTIEPTDQSEIEVTVQVDEYRQEKVKVSIAQKDPIELKMVPYRPLVFISKRSGKFDVYRIDADGQNEKLLLAGTGTEREDMAVLMHPTKDVAALVSTRNNQRNNDGFVLSGLFLIDTNTGETKTITHSERVQLVDWIGDSLTYVRIAEGASGTNPSRHRLMSYGLEAESEKELAASNYFNDVLVAEQKIYYAPSNAFQENNAAARLFRINADGTDKKTLLDREVWNIFRVDEKTLHISSQQDWYSYELGKDEKARRIDRPSVVPGNRLYVVNPTDDSKLLWADARDGKGVLLLTDANDKDKVLVSQSGLKYPVRWLNSKTILFRVATGEETADYIMNIDGGDPKKLTDVSDTSGADTWYYYQ